MILSHLIIVLLDLVTSFTLTGISDHSVYIRYAVLILHTSSTFLYEVFINNGLRMPDRVKLQVKSTKYKN